MKELTHQGNQNHPVTSLHSLHQIDSSVQTRQHKTRRQASENDAHGHALSTALGEIGLIVVPAGKMVEHCRG
jgi:hypothetical protein